MVKRLLKKAFTEAALDSGKDCLVNYVWINRDRDSSERKPSCSVSFKHLDCAYENARNYADARVKIWIDYRFLDERSRASLQTHYERFAPDNVELCDLNDIPDYTNDDMFKPGTTTGLWLRVDLARLLVLDHALKQEPENHVIYADFDVPDVKVNTAKKVMKKHGLALGSTGASKWPLGRVFKGAFSMLENGYFAFKKDPKGQQFLKNLLLTSFDRAREGCGDGFGAFNRVVEEWCDLHKVKGKEVAVPGVLYSMGYKIPDKRCYKTWNWN